MQPNTYGWRQHATAGSCSPTGEHRDIHLLNGAVKYLPLNYLYDYDSRTLAKLNELMRLVRGTAFEDQEVSS